MRITKYIVRAGWQMAASSPLVGPYMLAAQDDRVQYVREVTAALDSGVVYSRETGRKLDTPVPVDWTATC